MHKPVFDIITLKQDLIKGDFLFCRASGVKLSQCNIKPQRYTQILNFNKTGQAALNTGDTSVPVCLKVVLTPSKQTVSVSAVRAKRTTIFSKPG